MNRIKYGVRWLSKRPRAVLNVGFILFIIGLAIWVMVRPLDVLQDWTLKTSSDEVERGVPVFYPGETLEFTSKSVKLTDNEGTTNRIFDCDPTGKAPAREIALDKLIANRPAGYNAAKENSITVPDVIQFNGLPRTCRLVITINYEIFPGRNLIESARTNDFIVKERSLNPKEIQEQIDKLNQRIDELEGQLPASESASADDQVGAASKSTDVEGSPQQALPVTQVQPTATAQSQQTAATPTSSPVSPATPAPAVQPAQPGLITRLVDGVGGVLTSITRGLGL